jgi:aldose 1-epimerase
MKTIAALGVLAAMAIAAPAADAATAKRGTFGKLPDGRTVDSVLLTNNRGISANIIAYGASIQSLVMPDRTGKKADIALGHESMEGYLKFPNFIGSTVGRFANRINAGRFTLNGQTYQTPLNDTTNSLHGGSMGFDKVLWDVVSVKDGPTASVTLRYVSPDGDQGYPGKLTVDATYSLDEANNLTIEYTATTDKETIVNVTNHAYWNLSGEGSSNGAMGHVVTIPADSYTPVNETLIPTGELRPVAGTVLDFRKPRVINDRVRDASEQQIAYGRGYDHNWVIGREVTKTQHLMAKVSDPASGRSFELWSNQPGLQFYSGNFLNGTFSGKAKKIYRGGDAIVMEPQIFPDAINQKGFPEARLQPGQTYRNVMTYKFSSGAAAGRR